MPEGHTIHRLARDQRRDFVGEALAVSSPQGRFRVESKKLSGRVLEEIEAYGKHLFYRWEGGRIVHVHLGLYGKYRRSKAPPPEPRGQVRLRVVGDRYAFDLNGPNACELMDERGRDKIASRLGQDPLRRDADPEAAWKRISSSRAPIGTLLLDQSVIAGVGNIFRAEALFVEGIHPDRQGRELDRDEFDRLWATVTSMLKTGVKYNRIITSDPKVIGKPPSRMNKSERIMIYNKQQCPSCETGIDAWKLAARSIFACPACQN